MVSLNRQLPQELSVNNALLHAVNAVLFLGAATEPLATPGRNLMVAT
jgi:hypothetical protein